MTLERPRFNTTKLREGYDMGEVDDFVDRVFEALGQAAPTLSAEQVQQVRFTPVRLREGYDMDDVDQWLDVAVAELGRPGAAPAPAAYDGTRSTAITEVRAGVPAPFLVLVAIVVVVAVVVYVVL